MSYVPPSKHTPSALRKARWEREQEVLAAGRASAQAQVAKATLKPKAAEATVNLTPK
jgi:hypothetical protein